MTEEFESAISNAKHIIPGKNILYIRPYKINYLFLIHLFLEYWDGGRHFIFICIEFMEYNYSLLAARSYNI